MRVPLLALISGGCIPRLYTEGPDVIPSDWVAPENGWPISPPPGGIEGEGFEEGERVPDFRLQDQHGDEVSLWQFYGKVILLDVSTIWCGPCQDLAQDTAETMADYEDQGFVYVTVIQEDYEGNPPDDADLDFWADTFGITSPVLADGDKTGVGDDLEYPTVMTIGRNLKVRKWITIPDDEHVRDAIEAAL